MFQGSSRAQIGRTAIVLGVLAALAFFVSQTGVLNPSVVHIRNESSTAVNVAIEGNPGSATSKVVIVVPPWTEGTCPTGSWTIGAGNRPVGANLDPQVQPAATFPQGGPYYVRVDASGVIHVGEPVPTDPVGCKVYSVTSR
jgi:hypothetical protein